MALTAAEQQYFDETVAKVKYSVNVCVPIEAMDHDVLTGKHKEALGICWADADENGKLVPFHITIDEYFIHECFIAIEKPYMKLEPETLEQVIAHEIAHLTYWRHGKKHTEHTRYICGLIESGLPQGITPKSQTVSVPQKAVLAGGGKGPIMVNKQDILNAARTPHGAFVNTDGEWCSCKSPESLAAYIASLGFAVTRAYKAPYSTAIVETREGVRVAYNGGCSMMERGAC